MDARRLPASHGVLWLVAGFSLFRRNPPMMTTLTMGYLLLILLINFIPTVGPFLLPIVLPTLTVVLANGCRAVELSRNFSVEVLTETLKTQRDGLIRLGGLHLLGSSALLLVSLALGDNINIADGLSTEEATDLLTDMSILLLAASPILMAFWFAPLLTAWDGVSAGKSIFFSLVASWRNMRAFTLYGLSVTVVGILLPGLILVIAGLISPALLATLSMVLRMLLIFVLAPTLVASVYLSYRDVFAAPPIPAPPTATVDEIV